jgi:hypothetical protein
VPAEIPQGFQEFEFDLPPALLEQLVKKLDVMASGPLTEENVARVPNGQGVYQLFVGNDIVYIGKTDAEAGLNARLGRHVDSVRHRKGLDATRVRFKALRVMVFAAMDLETQLINHYRKTSTVHWNDSGFGNNDPGRNRDKTDLKQDGFDHLHPIDTDVALEVEWPKEGTVEEYLKALAKNVPYILRVERVSRGGKPHPDLFLPVKTLPKARTTARKAITEIFKSLPAGWQATALAGRIIFYKENANYAHGSIIART